MKLQRILPLSAILVGVAALPSLAGSSYVENSFNLKSIFNGKSSTTVNVDEIYKGWRSAGSDAVKKEWSTTKATEVKDGRYFSEVDKADIKTTSFAREKGDFTTTTAVRVNESYDFSGFDKDHRVTSGFDF
jgi:phage-related tail fiber protein